MMWWSAMGLLLMLQFSFTRGFWAMSYRTSLKVSRASGVRTRGSVRGHVVAATLVLLFVWMICWPLAGAVAIRRMRRWYPDRH